MTRNKIREIIKEKFGVQARLNVNQSYCGGKYYKYSVVWSATNQGFIFADTLKNLVEQIYER